MESIHGSSPASDGYQTYPKHHTAFQNLNWYHVFFFSSHFVQHCGDILESTSPRSEALALDFGLHSAGRMDGWVESLTTVES